MKKKGANDYRETSLRVLDEKIKRLTEMLGVGIDGGAPEAESVDGEKPRENISKSRERTARANAPYGVHDGHRQRMRESASSDRRLESFSDVELVEYLLSFVVPRKDTNVTAHLLLEKFGSVSAVLCATTDELSKIPNMTTAAASLVPVLHNICRYNGKFAVTVRSRNDVANFFGAAYASGVIDGMCAVFLDDGFGLIAVERISFEPRKALRAIVGSAIKRNAKNVLAVWCEKRLFDSGSELSAFLSDLSKVLRTVNVTFLDFVMFTDYGYYTLGDAKRDYDGWIPQYVFVPEKLFARSPRAFDKTHTAVSEQDKTPDESRQNKAIDMASQIYALLERKNGDA